MKDLKTFLKEKKEKLKITGSIASAIAIISTSSCSISGNNSDSSKSNSSNITNSYSATTKESTTIQTKESTLPETTTTTEKKKPITTQQTTATSTTTKTPETITTTTNEIITPAPITTNIPATEKPIESTTKTVTTKEPIKTTIVTTTEKVETTTTSTSKKIEEPIEYNTRTDEIKGYYNNTELNDTEILTENNVNNYEDFLSVASNINGGLYINYQVYYNLDTNKCEVTMTDAFLENILFLTFINNEYIDNKTLKDILNPYSYEELSYMTDNTIIIFNRNLYENIYYDFSKIIINKNLNKLLTNIQNAYKTNDYRTVEKLCNENYKKYNAFIDLMLLMYEHNMPEIENYITNENSFELSLQVIDKTGIYERAHQKTLVLQ